MRKQVVLVLGAFILLCIGVDAFADPVSVNLYSGGIGAVAGQAKLSLSNIAQLITAGAYVAGLGFAVAAIAKFKAHKDNPTQVAISMPISLLFIAAALIFLPSVFKSVGGTMYGSSGSIATVSGITKWT